jgi:hypothetical protein
MQPGLVKHFWVANRTGKLKCDEHSTSVCKYFYFTKSNLVPRACDPREGTWGSGIIRFREESGWPLIWNVQFGLSQDSWLPATDYPRASRSFPRIAGSENEIAPNHSFTCHSLLLRSWYIEDITQRREDMTFIFELWKQYFTNERMQRVNTRR